MASNIEDCVFVEVLKAQDKKSSSNARICGSQQYVPLEYLNEKKELDEVN